jgi:hypothetical protein
MKRWLCAFFFLVLVIVSFTCLLDVCAQQKSGHSQVSSGADATHDSHDAHSGGVWEGSAQGIAYSEFNHHFVGLFVLLFGFAELIQAMRSSSPIWTRLVLPTALGIVGLFLLVLSDHDAWPIGSLGFVQTFFGEDREIVQHKFYGILAAAAASSETLRRLGWAKHPAWAVPLIVLGIGGGLLLFAHSHGVHLSHEKIEFHHALMGSLGVGAGVSRALATWMACSSNGSARAWDFVWAGLILLMGVQLLMYFE